MTDTPPVARGPLLDVHRRGKATVAALCGWEVAMRYATEPAAGHNAVVDVLHNRTWEIGGPATGRDLTAAFGTDVSLRKMHVAPQATACRLTPARAIVFANTPDAEGWTLEASSAVDVTGGWASLALFGPDADTILAKVTAVDLREQTLPVHACCQGPVFGVNTLFCRFANRFELHVCPDSMQFFWEVLLDAGREFGLAPAGWEWMREQLAVSG